MVFERRKEMFELVRFAILVSCLRCAAEACGRSLGVVCGDTSSVVEFKVVWSPLIVAAAERRVGAALLLLFEQVAILDDQLGRFLQVDDAVVSALISRLVADELVVVRTQDGEGQCVWLTQQGLQRLGSSFVGAPTPRMVALCRRRAVSEARLSLRERALEGRWVCERDLLRVGGGSGFVPDAVLEVGGERHAIQVELAHCSRERLLRTVSECLHRYDRVSFYCSRQALAGARRVLKGYGGGRVSVVLIPYPDLTRGWSSSWFGRARRWVWRFVLPVRRRLRPAWRVSKRSLRWVWRSLRRAGVGLVACVRSVFG
jgi:hypothetical protein